MDKRDKLEARSNTSHPSRHDHISGLHHQKREKGGEGAETTSPYGETGDGLREGSDERPEEADGAGEVRGEAS